MKTIGITMGDAAGIGPEIIAGSWAEINRRTKDCRFVVYGHPEILQRASLLRKIDTKIPCITCTKENVTQVPCGVVDARAGEAAYQSIIRAIDDALAGTIDAIVTAPIHKTALNLAGYHYPGHTEIFAERCGINDFAMMLYLGHGKNIRSKNGLAVVHVTLHTAIKSIFEQITIESVLAKARLANNFMKQIIGSSGEPPRLGVCSLNPHAGEGGLFGDEEIKIIVPAVQKALTEGIKISLPCPADTIMIDAKNGQYDAVVAMFHDQGHIALKLLGIHRAVNVTLGLPIIRTSVAHGTAFNKAWRGIAETGSFIEAVHVAEKLIQNQ